MSRYKITMANVAQIDGALCKHAFLLVPCVAMRNWVRTDNGIFDPVNCDVFLNRARRKLGICTINFLFVLACKKVDVVCGDSCILMVIYDAKLMLLLETWSNNYATMHVPP